MTNFEQVIKDGKNSPQEVVQSARTTPNEAKVTSSNLSSPLLCGHVKKKGKKEKEKERIRQKNAWENEELSSGINKKKIASNDIAH
jgi:hypothetical protein